MRRFAIILSLLLALAPAGALGQVANRYGWLQVVGTQLQDQFGNPIQLKGMSSFWLNWDTRDGIGYANYDAIKWLRDNWNMQVFRVAMGVEAEGGYLDFPEATRDRVHRIVQACIDLGIYVIIDFHSHHAHQYLREAKDFFGEMAYTYGHLPNVLFEPFNEPLNVSWSNVVKPYHQAILDTIRAHAPNSIVLLGVPNWSQDVEVAALDPIDDPQVMLVLHFYAHTHRQRYRDKANLAMQRGAAIFVTEWGASAADGGQDMTYNAAEAQVWIDWMRQNRISWAAWNLHDKMESSAILAPNAPLFGGWDNDSYFKGHAFIVRQAMLQDPEPCLFHRSPPRVEMDYQGGRAPVAITTPSPWTGTLAGDWLTATPLAGPQGDTIWLDLPQNPTDSVRTARIDLLFTCPGEAHQYPLAVTIRQRPFIAVQGVTLSPDSLLLSVGDVYPLRAQVLPPDASHPQVAWHSLNPDVVTVTPQGGLQALALGTARVVATTTNGLTDTSHVEVIVCSYTVNIALNRTAAASSLEDASYPAALAVDGDPSTRWSSGPTDAEWISIDLGHTYYIDRVVLTWEAAYGSDYRIEVSADGSTWHLAHTATEGDGGADTISNLGAIGRFVRLHGDRRATRWGYSLWELQVWGCRTVERSYLMVTPSTIEADHTGLVQAVGVVADADWRGATDAPWVTLANPEGSGDGGFGLALGSNPTAQPRAGWVSVTSGALERRIRVTQAGMPTAAAAPATRPLGLTVHPVPAREHLEVGLMLGGPAAVTYAVINSLGHRVLAGDLGQQPAGPVRHTLALRRADGHRLAPGLYLLQVAIQGHGYSRREARRFVVRE